MTTRRAQAPPRPAPFPLPSEVLLVDLIHVDLREPESVPSTPIGILCGSKSMCFPPGIFPPEGAPRKKKTALPLWISPLGGGVIS